MLWFILCITVHSDYTTKDYSAKIWKYMDVTAYKNRQGSSINLPVSGFFFLVSNTDTQIYLSYFQLLNSEIGL